MQDYVDCSDDVVKSNLILDMILVGVLGDHCQLGEVCLMLQSMNSTEQYYHHTRDDNQKFHNIHMQVCDYV